MLPIAWLKKKEIGIYCTWWTEGPSCSGQRGRPARSTLSTGTHPLPLKKGKSTKLESNWDLEPIVSVPSHYAGHPISVRFLMCMFRLIQEPKREGPLAGILPFVHFAHCLDLQPRHFRGRPLGPSGAKLLSFGTASFSEGKTAYFRLWFTTS